MDKKQEMQIRYSAAAFVIFLFAGVFIKKMFGELFSGIYYFVGWATILWILWDRFLYDRLNKYFKKDAKDKK